MTKDRGDVALLQSFLVGDFEEETVVGSGSEGDDRDAVRFLAQRAIDPEYKARRANGPFVYIKNANQGGRSFYVKEEMEKLKGDAEDQRSRGVSQGSDYRGSGTVGFDGSRPEDEEEDGKPAFAPRGTSPQNPNRPNTAPTTRQEMKPSRQPPPQTRPSHTTRRPPAVHDDLGYPRREENPYSPRNARQYPDQRSSSNHRGGGEERDRETYEQDVRDPRDDLRRRGSSRPGREYEQPARQRGYSRMGYAGGVADSLTSSHGVYDGGRDASPGERARQVKHRPSHMREEEDRGPRFMRSRQRQPHQEGGHRRSPERHSSRAREGSRPRDSSGGQEGGQPREGGRPRGGSRAQEGRQPRGSSSRPRESSRPDDAYHRERAQLQQGPGPSGDGRSGRLRGPAHHHSDDQQRDHQRERQQAGHSRPPCSGSNLREQQGEDRPGRGHRQQQDALQQQQRSPSKQRPLPQHERGSPRQQQQQQQPLQQQQLLQPRQQQQQQQLGMVPTRSRREHEHARQRYVDQWQPGQGSPGVPSRSPSRAARGEPSPRKLAQELRAMQGKLEAVKGKLDSAVSRRRTLESDMAGVKEQLAVVLDRRSNDDRLIAALKAQLSGQRSPPRHERREPSPGKHASRERRHRHRDSDHRPQRSPGSRPPGQEVERSEEGRHGSRRQRGSPRRGSGRESSSRRPVGGEEEGRRRREERAGGPSGRQHQRTRHHGGAPRERPGSRGSPPPRRADEGGRRGGEGEGDSSRRGGDSSHRGGDSSRRGGDARGPTQVHQREGGRRGGGGEREREGRGVGVARASRSATSAGRSPAVAAGSPGGHTHASRTGMVVAGPGRGWQQQQQEQPRRPRAAGDRLQEEDWRGRQRGSQSLAGGGGGGGGRRQRSPSERGPDSPPSGPRQQRANGNREGDEADGGRGEGQQAPTPNGRRQDKGDGKGMEVAGSDLDDRDGDLGMFAGALGDEARSAAAAAAAVAAPGAKKVLGGNVRRKAVPYTVASSSEDEGDDAADVGGESEEGEEAETQHDEHGRMVKRPPAARADGKAGTDGDGTRYNHKGQLRRQGKGQAAEPTHDEQGRMLVGAGSEAPSRARRGQPAAGSDDSEDGEPPSSPEVGSGRRAVARGTPSKGPGKPAAAASAGRAQTGVDSNSDWSDDDVGPAGGKGAPSATPQQLAPGNPATNAAPGPALGGAPSANAPPLGAAAAASIPPSPAPSSIPLPAGPTFLAPAGSGFVPPAGSGFTPPSRTPSEPAAVRPPSGPTFATPSGPTFVPPSAPTAATPAPAPAPGPPTSAPLVTRPASAGVQPAATAQPLPPPPQPLAMPQQRQPSQPSSAYGPPASLSPGFQPPAPQPLADPRPAAVPAFSPPADPPVRASPGAFDRGQSATGAQDVRSSLQQPGQQPRQHQLPLPPPQQPAALTTQLLSQTSGPPVPLINSPMGPQLPSSMRPSAFSPSPPDAQHLLQSRPVSPLSVPSRADAQQQKPAAPFAAPNPTAAAAQPSPAVRPASASLQQAPASSGGGPGAAGGVGREASGQLSGSREGRGDSGGSIAGFVLPPNDAGRVSTTQPFLPAKGGQGFSLNRGTT
ncbi:MAG: hypothetical protein WDW38_001824 [Sanguina aurantia]